MAVLIDPPLWPAHGRRWSHLASDVSLRELHEFAGRVGIPERGFEGDHYDVPEERYADTVTAGAIPVSSRELLRRLQESGLRRQKRRGERVLASRGEASGVRLDAMLSALPPLGPVTTVHALVVAGQDVLVLPEDVGFRLPVHELAPGEEDAGSSAQSLVAALLGGVVRPVLQPPHQVGYLRRLRPSGRILGNEVVLRFVVEAAGRPDPAGGSVWVVARHVVPLLDGAVAPIAAGGSYRPPERALRPAEPVDG